MKQLNYILFTLVVVITWGMYSCSKMDDYLQYTGGQERLYTGKVDSVIIRSGKERVMVSGLLVSDPKITKVKIYWNTRNDSIILDIKRTAGVDTIRVPVALPEGNYNFEIFSFDNAGHSSVKVNASGASYGAVYQQSLFNRSVKRAEKVGNDVIIDWYNGEETSPFTQVVYTDSRNTEHVIRVTNETERTTLTDFKTMSKFTLQSYFLPDSMAIDTFTAEINAIGVNEDITALYLKNPGSPFARGDNGTGKWGLPKDWLYNTAVINQNSSQAGGWSTDGNPGGVLHFESKDWGGDGVTNGKIYQTFTLPEGNYMLEFYSDGGGSSSFVNANFVAAAGSVLPDITNLADVLAKYHWDQNGMGGTHSINFSLDKPTQVAVGWVVSTGTTSWMHINNIKLRITVQ